MHGLIATGVNADGKREILGLDVATAGDGAGWLAFLRGLAARGLAGVQMVTSDCHHGLRDAIASVLPGASRQRCRAHWSRKEITCCFSSWGRMCWYGDLVRGWRSAGGEARVLLAHLNERQRRLLLEAEARLLGRGGVRLVARLTGVSEATVRGGVFESEAGGDPLPGGRVRRPRGGRKSAEHRDPGLVPAPLALVEPDERGDPELPLRWTAQSPRHLAGELARQGHVVPAPTAGRLLREKGFSLQGNAKTLEGERHPDRDAQFCYINEQVKDHQPDGVPVISVDTKKREQLGRLPMGGREWHPKGEPVQVEDHSFFTRPDVGPPIQQDWAKYAPGEPLPKTCA